MKWVVIVVLVAIIVYLIKRGKNNVCTTFSDYYTDRDNNPNCYLNPDHELEAPEIIKRHGYPVETYTVLTDDGYILTLYRIPHGLSSNRSSKLPVLLNHGTALNCGSFLVNKRPFAFMLVEAGYDVWLGNFRGTSYSRKHKTLSDTDEEFWNFSMHELGVYDLPAQIQLITEKTNKKIIYIGFSLGSSAGYIYSSTYPEGAKAKIEYFISLGPGVFVRNFVLYNIYGLWNLALPILNYFSGGEIYPRPIFPKFLYKIMCFPLPFQMRICQIPDMILLGYNYDDDDPETLPATLLHNIDATSLKTLNHYAQVIYTENFQNYNYEEEQNKILYSNSVPPHYDLAKVQVSSYIVYSENDFLLPEKGIHKLYNSLPNTTYFKTLYKIKNTKYNHIDFLSAKNAHEFVYTPIIEELKRWEQQNNKK